MTFKVSLFFKFAESRFNYTTAALSPNGLTLLAVNEDGEIHLISLISRTVLHRYLWRKEKREKF
jgi:periodic tryptophan protein 2